MTRSGIPEPVQHFVRRHINSVEELEVLLLLFRTPQQFWTPLAVSRELRIDPVSAARRLDDFLSRELAQVRAEGESLEFAYRSAPDTDETIRDLERTYAERRTALIEFIFSAPIRDVRVFADAFRLRKKE